MWLKRGNKEVFYLSHRVNGKPTKTHIGTGIFAERVAAEVEDRKRVRAAVSEACALFEARAIAAEQPLDALCESLELLATASLLALGFHRHDRSQWRKRRERRKVQAE
jgi:hypothetical protein